ncbi:YecA family protein [Heyndrickxia sporothermodurans]
MKVNRNEPCPCGSGKKYKKCCLLKDNIVQISEVREERFLQERHELIMKLMSFLDRKISRNQVLQLHSEFRRRTQGKISDTNEVGFFQYWLNYFYFFENGLRGIEWFLKENSSNITIEERRLAENWVKMTPKVVQAIGMSDTEILFEDVVTKEKYTILNKKEYVTEPAPWVGTISLIEHFGNLDYFNGVRVFLGPQNISRVNAFIQKLIAETNLSRELVLFKYYPEIICEFLKDGNEHDADPQEKEIQECTIQFQVKEEKVITDFLQGESEFVIDYWDKDVKKLSWLCNWMEYTDNEMNGKAQLAENLGTISLEKNVLQFNCYDTGILDQFKQKILKNEKSVVLINEKIQSHFIPHLAEIKNMAVHFSENVPKYFALYAQNNFNLELDRSIPMFDQLSPRELMDKGRADDVEMWLKEHEYRLYQHVKSDFGKVEKTADFNTVRKELGLPVSPFVTGGENRNSSIISIKSPHQRTLVNKEDIPFYEDLGFKPDTIDNFYAKSLVSFFKEKTGGKSENTIRKYKYSLYDLREILEDYSLYSWDGLTQKLWERIITKDYFDLFYSVSKTQVKDFLSTLKTLAKWLDGNENTRLSDDLLMAIEKTEKKRLRIVGV